VITGLVLYVLGQCLLILYCVCCGSDFSFVIVCVCVGITGWYCVCCASDYTFGVVCVGALITGLILCFLGTYY